VELYVAVRRAVMVDGLSHREAARRFGVHRNTISKMLQYSAPSGYRHREAAVSPKLGPHIAWIDAVLEADRGVHAEQRHTAQRMFDRLRAEEGYTGGYTVVGEYVTAATLRTREMFVTLIHRPGHAQADFGEADGYIGGKLVQFHYFAWACRSPMTASSRRIRRRSPKHFVKAIYRPSIILTVCRSRFCMTTPGLRWPRS
jgi:transposase